MHLAEVVIVSSLLHSEAGQAATVKNFYFGGEIGDKHGKADRNLNNYCV